MIQVMENTLQAEVKIERSETEERLTPRAAAVAMLPDFRRMARLLWPGDRSTQDDLVQEMALAVLSCRQPDTRGRLMQRGIWSARDYLRWWADTRARRWRKKRPEQAKKPSADPARHPVAYALNRAVGLDD